ncbi:unnamed protein product, partial [Didymodactylos carnosus]
MNQQRNQTDQYQHEILSRLSSNTSSRNETYEPVHRTLGKINVKPKEFNGNNNENVVTWLVSLEELFENQHMTDGERITMASSVLNGTALQWFVNLRVRGKRPTSWSEFKEQLKSA